MVVTRSKTFKQNEAVATMTQNAPRPTTASRKTKPQQSTPRQTKKTDGKVRKGRKKTSEGKTTKIRKNVKGLAQRNDPSADTDLSLPLQMVTIPLDVVYALNSSTMQHFVVKEEETDTSVDSELSQLSKNSIEPLQRDNVENFIKSESTLSTKEAVEQTLSVNKLNVTSAGIQMAHQFNHTNVDSLAVIKKETQSHLDEIEPCISSHPRPTNVISLAVVMEESQSHHETVDLSPSTTNVDALSIITKKIHSHLQAVEQGQIFAPCAPRVVNIQPISGSDSQQKDLSQTLKVEFYFTNSMLEYAHSNEWEDCPSPASTVIKDEFENEPLSPMGLPGTLTIKTESADSVLSSEDYVETQSVNMNDGNPIVEPCSSINPVDALAIIKEKMQSCQDTVEPCDNSSLSVTKVNSAIIREESQSQEAIGEDNLSLANTSVSQQELCVIPVGEKDCKPLMITLQTRSVLEQSHRNDRDQCLSPASTIVREELSPTRTFISSDSEDECSSTSTIFNSKSEYECPSPARTIIKSESEDGCPSPSSIESINSKIEDDLRRAPERLVHSELQTEESTRHSSSDSLHWRENSSYQERRRVEHHRRQASTERNIVTDPSSSKTLHPSKISANDYDYRFGHNYYERVSRRFFKIGSGSESDSCIESNNNSSPQRPKRKQHLRKIPPSTDNKRNEYQWSNIKLPVTSEEIRIDTDSEDFSEPDYGWEDPPPPKRKCVEQPKLTQNVNPGIHEKMQIFVGKLNNEFDLDAIEGARKDLFEAIEESIVVQSSKKLIELDQRIQKKKDDYVKNLFGTVDFSSWDNDPALN